MGCYPCDLFNGVFYGVHVLHQFIRDHSFFQKHFENKTGNEFFNPLDICSAYFWHGIAIAIPVPASISNQSMDMGVPVGRKYCLFIESSADPGGIFFIGERTAILLDATASFVHSVSGDCLLQSGRQEKYEIGRVRKVIIPF